MDGPLADLSVDSVLRQYADDIAQSVFQACLNNEDPVKSMPRVRRISIDSESLRQDLKNLQSSLKRQRTEIETLTQNARGLRATSSAYHLSSEPSWYGSDYKPALRHKASTASLKTTASQAKRRRELFGFRRKVRNWWYKPTSTT
ncbi:hypothetical protein B9G98_04590 [Wickerhamiella sorbophila]|uniref:Uncharacterized protein n=1 Tax=Wickerhamiella sorbophila TaxID=45607 RepID=A0A2T0FPP6_9ASCO|nr:hypothetical protein B9G98_04590 [Wickerhamiella sorbophila]PRT56970.1 hypothetical protein B9G98_04590 [Wickerhamiella sorbophila]